MKMIIKIMIIYVTNIRVMKHQCKNLVKAIKMNHNGCLQTLLLRIRGENEITNCPCNQKNINGWTSLHWVSHYGNTEGIRILLDHGTKCGFINVNIKNNLGSTPLHIASSKIYSLVGNISDFIQILLENGANVNEKDNNGCTPLHRASDDGSTRSIQILLSNGANINEKDNNGSTPLHYASSQGPSGSVKILLENGANVNEKDNNGSTPLHYVSKFGSIYGLETRFDEHIKSLLDFGADINLKDNNWQSPIDIANENTKRFIENYLHFDIKEPVST
jgi:ankyrin repeat protein